MTITSSSGVTTLRLRAASTSRCVLVDVDHALCADETESTQVNPGQSQPYAPPRNAPQYQSNGYGNEKDPYANGRFKPKARVNDIFFLILFLAQFLAYAGLSGYVIHKLIAENGLGGGVGSHNTGTSITLNQYASVLTTHVRATDERSGTPFTCCSSSRQLPWFCRQSGS
jgi:hypothetical protein